MLRLLPLPCPLEPPPTPGLPSGDTASPAGSESPPPLMTPQWSSGSGPGGRSRRHGRGPGLGGLGGVALAVHVSVSCRSLLSSPLDARAQPTAPDRGGPQCGPVRGVGGCCPLETPSAGVLGTRVRGRGADTACGRDLQTPARRPAGAALPAPPAGGPGISTGDPSLPTLAGPGFLPCWPPPPAHSGPGSARPCPGPAPWLPHARAAERAAGPGSSGSSGCRRWGPLPGHLTSGTDAFLQALHHPSSLSCPLPPVCRSQACGGPNLCFTGRHLEAASEHCRAGIDLRAEPPPSRSPES